MSRRSARWTRPLRPPSKDSSEIGDCPAGAPWPTAMRFCTSVRPPRLLAIAARVPPLAGLKLGPPVTCAVQSFAHEHSSLSQALLRARPYFGGGRECPQPRSAYLLTGPPGPSATRRGGNG